MKTQVMLLAALMLAGCGTFETVVRSDEAAVKRLKERKTYCGAVPRIYSGVTYDFCTLHALPGPGIDEYQYDGAGTPVVLLDVVISGVLDTMLLPYTIYRQQADGSIIVAE
ncbi:MULTISPECIES: YceK/YidQ family lipoprotein [Gammaproteobacteria]|uniref:YceK/YidQ family lipoprotein n=1 Tax=Pseudomonas farris TaxID=2841207 RepID=A0ABS6PTP8_9PSED|nr:MULTISPECIES: YceK/YidQ family lipoprotein [Gammaproteobacteria]MBK5304485.1 YceK/YidQ family lipoprotein [Bacillus sp. TH86]MBK5324254.1 YceK/YidQ family lipoprotein [Bacillus sp. TH59]MBK5339204.1 YceK/YidQ family lipoprotein [Bacillus sp. TH57]MBK5313253.1 YceK/YidQ family lipoprotein [Pseudomonas sp. TH71]MBK5318751.1 YceK/YidQ family lipoprotein [Erwinia sp. TH79]